MGNQVVGGGMKRLIGDRFEREHRGVHRRAGENSLE
jgi:hypothetical protein